MKILHICLANFYIDNYTYQENLLTKYHKKMGHHVEILASNVTFNDDGEVSLFNGESKYINENFIQVYRIDFKRFPFSKILKLYKSTYNYLEKIKPDVLFIHGPQFLDIIQIIKYLKKNKDITVYIDNHADFNNSAKTFLSKHLLHKILWRHFAKLISPYTKKFYGVLPKRVDFLIEVYKIPKEKVELLVMGVDDELLKEISIRRINKFRNLYNISSENILIVTGGKLDHNKTEVLTLMKSVKNIDNPNIKLLIFGSINTDYKFSFNQLLDNDIIYVGWLNPFDIYTLLNEADLVIYPGLHSVLWEQTVGIGKPCIFNYIEGYTHIDLGGNCKFIYEDSVIHISKVIEEVLKNSKTLHDMKVIAIKKGIKEFSYKKIANDSLS